MTLKHIEKIARDTLCMADPMIAVMGGGMSKAQAQAIVARIDGIWDDPELQKIGDLSDRVMGDIRRICQELD